MSSRADEPGMVVYPPEVFLEPWTRRRLGRVAERREDLGSVLARLGRQRRVTTALDPVVDRHLAETAPWSSARTLGSGPPLKIPYNATRS